MTEKINYPLETVSHLREVFMQRLDFLEELMRERQETHKVALDLNAREIARRLEILNGEAERLRQIQATYLPRELYENNFNAINRAINEIQTTMATQQGRSQVLSAAISAGISIVIAVITVFGSKLFH